MKRETQIALSRYGDNHCEHESARVADGQHGWSITEAQSRRRMFAQKYLILLSLPTGERNIDSFLNGILLALIKKQELSNGLIAETICRRYYLCEFTEKMKFVSTLKHYWPE